MLKRLLFIISLLCSVNVVAQSSWFWGRGSSSNGGVNKASAVCADQNGNCYVTGSYYGPDVSFGTNSFIDTNANLGEVFVTKYDQNGNVIWAVTSSCDGGAGAADIATDTNGNVIITGNFQGNYLVLGAYTLYKFPTTYVSTDMFVAKLDPNGNFLWAISNGLEYSEFGSAVGVDLWNNIYVAGIFESDSMMFGSSVIHNSATGKEIFIAKYDAQGNTIWANGATGSYDEYVNDLCVDNSGNAVIAGYTSSPTLDFGSTQITAQGIDGYIVKFDSSGTDQWSRKITGMYAEWTRGVDADVQGNLYVTGVAISDTVWFGNLFFESNVMGDAYLAKYDSSGTPQWVRAIRGQYMDFGYKVAVSTSTEIYVAMASQSEIVDFGALNAIGNPGEDYYLSIAKYDNNGNDLCTGTIGTRWNGDNGAVSIASDNSGGIFLGSRYGSSIVVGSDSLTTNSSIEVVVARFICNGVVGVTDQTGNNEVSIIYPNPTRGFVNVSVNYQPQVILIYNSLGGQVLCISDCSYHTQLDLSGLAAGMYSLTVMGENEIQTARIIVE